MILTWQDPPGQGRATKSAIDDAVRELQERPGQWALVAKYVASSRRAAFIRRGCEVALHQVSLDPQRVDVYARWPED